MVSRYLAGVLLVSLFASAAPTEEIKVYRTLSTEQLESLLKAATIKFQKLEDKKSDSIFYDYKVKSFNLRLYFLGGKQLLLDTLFPAMSLDKINQWNLGTKFTRAALGDDGKGGSFTAVESRLNLKGGVTEEAIKEYLGAFTEELDQFQVFAKAGGEPPALTKDETTFTEVTAKQLEKILDDLKVKYEKAELDNGGTTYQYQAKDAKITLLNWGKDMMLEAHYPKLDLAKVNKYNLDRKFIRAVSYSNKKGDYSALEANLSFVGGVSDSIVRNFITAFEEDAREFGAYVAKAKE